LPQPTGVDNYLKNLVIHLGRIDRDTRYLILVNWEDRRLFPRSLPRNFEVVPFSFRPRPVRLLSQQIGLPAFAMLAGVDVIHSPSFLMPVLRGRQRHVLTVHDMTSFSLPACHIPLRRSAAYRRALGWSIRHADLVIVPSCSTRQDILKLVPELPAARIKVIAEGVGEEFRRLPAPQTQEAIRRLKLPMPYILYVGTIEPRKNLGHLVECFGQLIRDGDLREHLVLAGRLGWGYDELLARVRSPALRGRVHLAGYVAQEDLPAVYAGASLFVYPSLQEGFGFPPLEAMACGVPVIASRSSSLAENLAGAAELVPPTDAAALIEALRRLLTDPQLRAQRREQGLARATLFRWDETARRTLDCYRTLAA
jgi:glycosyltransferase involved in cell wall biosynthesis